MKKTVWIINQYASTPDVGMGGRHYYFARELAAKGYQVYLIAASFHHLLRKKADVSETVTMNMVDGFTFVQLNVPEYGDAHSKKRILNWFLFTWMLRKLPASLPHLPDTILYSSPALIGFLGARKLARRFNAKLVFEVRDIWPLTLTEIGNFSERHMFIRFMQWIEDKAYRTSDNVISNLQHAIVHMTQRGMAQEKFEWIPNGFLLEEVNNKEALPVAVRDLIPRDKFVVGYTGTIGAANALEKFIEAAAILRHDQDIVFVLVGNGKEKAVLQKQVSALHLANVLFIDAIPKKEIQSMLSLFDVCFIGWRNQSLYRFGIGANKLPEYMYSGKPILHSYSGACDPVEMAGCGVTVEAESAEKIANAVLTFKNMSREQRVLMGEKGKQFAMNHFEYGILRDKLEKILFD